MEDSKTIKTLIEHLDFFASIDLENAFHSVPLHPDSKRLVVFEINGQRFSYNVLPFGLTSSPRIFTKILKTVISFLRSSGIKITSYLDDIFICGNSASKVSKDLQITIELLINLGFSINWKKSNLIPSQILMHLGFIWNSIDLSISLPEQKWMKIKSMALQCLKSSKTLRTYSILLGLMVNASNGFLFAPIYYRKFQLCFVDALKVCSSWEEIWHLDDDSLSDLSWWASSSFSMLTPVSFKSRKFDSILFTDSSMVGWGATLSSGEMASGNWSKEDSRHHINYLELKAVYLAIKEFLPILLNKHISIRCDNTTAIFYLNKMGGTHSRPLCLLALSIWKLINSNSISFIASHISGIDNTVADFFSRFSHHHEFFLSQDAFMKILNILPFSLNLDLFASRHNKKLDHYCSMFDDPDCLHIDAFSFNWPSNVYIFPPIPLIAKALLKALLDKVDSCLFITPAWSSLSVVPILSRHLISNPIFVSSHYLLGCLPTRHPFHLMAWPISTSSVRIKNFQKRLQKPSSRALMKIPSSHMQEYGNNLLNFLMNQNLEPIFLLP